eukprot:2064632-Lingulodinium_polyedra.AAC.1
MGSSVPRVRSASAVLRQRNSRSGGAATSDPKRAMGKTLPRARRALPATSLGSRFTARAAA